MLLPNPERAIVDPAKVRDYLLSHEHPDGRAKAAAFERYGYRRSSWEVLQRDLSALALSADAISLGRSTHGQKYLLSARIMGPFGRALFLRTVWIVRWGEDFPRFVTAYPGIQR